MKLNPFIIKITTSLTSERKKKQLKISRKKKDDGFFTKHSRARLILLNQGMLGEGGTMRGIRRHERHTDAATG